MYKVKFKNYIFLALISTFMSALSQPRLLIKIPTRSRPEQFFKVLDEYYKNLSGYIPYFFLITCDKDDQTMNNKKVIKKFNKYKNLHAYFGNNKSKIEAYNKNIDAYPDFDILLVASDDAVPAMRGYDKFIADLMVSRFPDLDGVLNFNDGYVGPDLNTLPVIGKKYYDRFGYVYHPAYKSLCCDNELTLVSKALNKELYSNNVIIRHNHPGNNKNVKYDELYLKNDKWFQHDLEIFQNRKKSNFYVDYLENKTGFKLSILICTLEERKESFDFIYNKLMDQIKANNLENEVEVLYFCDNRNYTVGYKRNELIKRSKGEYICFADDDDDVSENYVKMIYEKLKSKPDCVSLVGIITTKGINPKYFYHSIKYKEWFEKNNVYYRPPNHLNPIKKYIAVQFPFPEINFGEDAKWSMAISKSGLLKKEEVINEPYYFYLSR